MLPCEFNCGLAQNGRKNSAAGKGDLGRTDNDSAYEIILGTLLGGLLGFSVRKVMQFAERRNYIDRQSFVAQYVSLALLSTGGTVLLGSDDLLSAFACGCAFAWE